MSPTAVVILLGAGELKFDAYTWPETCAEVEFEVAGVRRTPVIAVEAVGLTPMWPVIADGGTVEMPDSVRMAKSPAVPRSTGSVTAAVARRSGPQRHGVGGRRCREKENCQNALEHGHVLGCVWCW